MSPFKSRELSQVNSKKGSERDSKGEKDSVCPSWFEDGRGHIRRNEVALGELKPARKQTSDLLLLKLDSVKNITELEVDSCLDIPDKGLSLIWAL